MVTHEELTKYVRYYPETGIFKSALHPNKTVGFLNKDGYVILRVGSKKQITAGKAAFMLMTGAHPQGDIDHENRVRNDNRWSNLRHITHAENCQNKGMYVNNTSGIKGVSFHKATQKWRVSIKHQKKQYEGGLFDCKDKAAEFADLLRQMIQQ